MSLSSLCKLCFYYNHGDKTCGRSLVAVSKAMEGLTPKVMASDIGVPLHPGAAKYYKEVGAL